MVSVHAVDAVEQSIVPATGTGGVMKLTTDTINGVNIDVEVNSSGQFSAEFEDVSYSAPTRLALLEQLTKAVKKAQQAGIVPVTILGRVKKDPKDRHAHMYDSGPYENGAGVIHALLRSKHAKEWNAYLLVSDDADKQKFKMSGSREGVLARRLTADEVTHWKALRDALDLAELALEEFEKHVSIDADEALEAAAAAKAGAK
jgi:hypothetical protein